MAHDAARAFERVGVPYYLCGSMASSTQGIVRATADVDFVVDVMPQHIAPLVAALSETFEVDEDMLREAVEWRRSLNIFSLKSAIKVDLFVAGFESWPREQFKRLTRSRLTRDDPREIALPCPEDTVVAKLIWYRKGGEVSDRQWSDILGVLRVQAGSLDLEHMRRWARNNDVHELLERALAATAG